MDEIGLFQAKNTFGQLLDRPEQGEEVVITRRGRPVAKLIPVVAGSDREQARRVVASIRERRKGVTLGNISIRELIDEGRK